MKIQMFIGFNLIYFLISTEINAQDLINTTNVITIDSGVTSGGSSVFSHISKYGILSTGEEFGCGLETLSNSPLLYTISQQADLVYFELYYDSLHTNIKEQGYYRLIYISNEIGYCWKGDLVWNHYDINGILNKKEFYNKGEIKNDK